MLNRRGVRALAAVGAVAALMLQPSVPAASAPGDRLTLVFQPQPADAKAGEVLTSEAFDPTGDPVVVKVMDGSRVANVRETITVSVMTSADTVVTSATVTTERGIAELAFTAPSPGYGYTLFAQPASDISPQRSSAFDTYEQAQLCRNSGGSTCVVETGRPQSMTVSVSANTTNGALALNIDPGAPPTTCNGVDIDSDLHSPSVVVQDEFGITVDKIAVITIAKEIVQARGDNDGASFYDVCFAKEGEPEKLLEPCPPRKRRDNACILSRNKTGAGDVEITILIPAGDPTWW